MFYKIILFIALPMVLFSQEFSHLAAPDSVMLNFKTEPKICSIMDTKHAMGWEKSYHAVKSFNEAEHYCQNLTQDGFSWHLPNLYEMKTFNKRCSQLKKMRNFPQKGHVLLSGKAIWDSENFFYFDLKSSVVKNSTKTGRYLVRCATNL